MIIVYIICLLFPLSAVACGYDICPRERMNFIPRNKPFVAPSAIELVAINKSPAMVIKTDDSIIEKLTTLREKFKNSGKKQKAVTPPIFTAVEIRHLFNTEWAYPDYQSPTSKRR